ncbi:hypothetical protein [Xanthomonas phaseoli]|uniref:hypothetical protein n=1 Tax=Xanthomonas phaseoli TaxID=1985254 RepID=UPI000377A1E6|nr:hypothetical protein [Xanthomonas phaseoli]
MVFQPDENEMDGAEVKSMPNFIPPEAAKEVQQPAQSASEQSPAPETPAASAPAQSAPAAPVEAPQGTPAAVAADKSEQAQERAAPAASATTPEQGTGTAEPAAKTTGSVSFKPAAKAPDHALDEELDAERASLSQVLAATAAAVLAERSQSAAQQPRTAPPPGPQGQVVQQPAAPAGAFEAIASGVNSMVNNTVGAAAGAVRGVVGGVASALARKPSATGELAAGGVMVLPRLSEYRVDQVERAASAYEEAHEQFWAADKMPFVRKEIEERARQTGISVEDVVSKMKPGGEFSDLAEKFNLALAESPAAQDSRKAMNKALDGFVKQYGRAQEELLNPETENNPHYRGLKYRLGQSLGKMSENAAGLPRADGEEQSHLERLKDAMAKIAEKLKEIVRDFVNTIRGRGVGKEADNAPSP